MGSLHKRIGTRRLVVSAYSATNQRRFAEADGAFFVDSLVAQLRLDSLVAETIVVPDTYMFDGRFFIDITPDELVSKVGRGVTNRRLPIEVAGRASAPQGERLAVGLRRLLVRDGSDMLNGFPFNSISDLQARTHLAAALSTTPTSELNRHFSVSGTSDVAASLAEFLRQRADPVAHTDIERLRLGWQRWIDAERRHLIDVSEWRSSFNIVRALRDRPLLPGTLVTKVGLETHQYIVNEILRTSQHRSDVARYLGRVREDYGLGTSAEHDAESDDLATIDAWYSMGRHVAFARQHRADVASAFTPGDRVTGHLDMAIEGLGADGHVPDIIAPADVLNGLAVMPGDNFGRFTYESRGRLAAVWCDGNIRDVKALLDNLQDHIRREETSTKRLEMFSALGLAAGAVSASAAAFANLGVATIASIISVAGGTFAVGESIPHIVNVWKRQRSVTRAIHYLSHRSPL